MAVARGAEAMAVAALVLRGGGGAAARGWPRAWRARPLCTAPGAAGDMKRYLWARYRDARRSTDGECRRPGVPIAAWGRLRVASAACASLPGPRRCPFPVPGAARLLPVMDRSRRGTYCRGHGHAWGRHLTRLAEPVSGDQ